MGSILATSVAASILRFITFWSPLCGAAQGFDSAYQGFHALREALGYELADDVGEISGAISVFNNPMVPSALEGQQPKAQTGMVIGTVCDWAALRKRFATSFDSDLQNHEDRAIIQWVVDHRDALRAWCCLDSAEPHCWAISEEDKQQQLQELGVVSATYAKCCFERLGAALRDPPAWVQAEVGLQREQLRSAGWGTASLSREHLDALAARLEGMPPFRVGEGPIGTRLCRFRVHGGHVQACDVQATSNGHDDALLRAMQLLGELTPLPDLDFFVSTTDVEHQDWEVPIFTKARPNSCGSMLLMPHEFLLTNWNRKLDLLVRRAARVWPWEHKDTRLFWRGGATAQWLCAQPDGTECNATGFSMTPDTLATSPRGRVALLSSFAPADVDARFTGVINPDLRAMATRWGLAETDVGNEDAGPVRRHSYEDYFAYRYHWNDEHSDAVFWRLRGNSVQFLTVGHYTHWLLPYGATLQPFVHFVPVRHDQGDLLERLRWAREHDSEARKIASAAANATAELLDPNGGPLAYLYQLLLLYAELQAF